MSGWDLTYTRGDQANIWIQETVQCSHSMPVHGGWWERSLVFGFGFVREPQTVGPLNCAEGIKPWQRPSLRAQEPTLTADSPPLPFLDLSNLEFPGCPAPLGPVLTPCHQHPNKPCGIQGGLFKVSVPFSILGRDAQPYDIHWPHLLIHSCIHALIHSFNKYSLGSYCRLNFVLGSEDTPETKSVTVSTIVEPTLKSAGNNKTRRKIITHFKRCTEGQNMGIWIGASRCQLGRDNR